MANYDGQYMFEEIDVVLDQFIAQYPLTQVKDDPRYERKGTIKRVLCQSLHSEWDKIVLTLYYSFERYPNLGDDEVLRGPFLSECKMDMVKSLAQEMNAERVQCRYCRNKGTITISFYNNSQKEVLTIRVRPGWPLDEDEQHYWSISSE